ncbi:MAG: UDP-N-acetylmuramoyl-L-alanyl-D-glutamate--2,6-diaminopimelate ligase [Gammaproteobacteria bacterium]|nr:UDP-N-acetylmuramoyl-L-alanyl-D-glutamate--2,6-diaminopimelate ligase [Gammaproteobacteria bacterium]
MTAQSTPERLTFAELIAGIYFIRQAPTLAIGGLCLDSRKVQKGDLFFALGGEQVHGKEFIDDAIKRGASVVLWASPTARQEVRGDRQVPVYGVPDLKNRVGYIAERFYGEPTKSQFVIGVTGTNGKTSVTRFIAHALQKDEPCGVLGTLGNGVFGRLEKGDFTTPDAITLHTLLDDLRHENVQRVVMEASSHGLEQGRVAGVAFDVAVFTNLSHEHLDYHGTMENYGQAKRRLFETKGLKYAVINIDDDYGRQLLTSMPGVVGTVSYGFGDGKGGDDVLPSLLGSRLQLDRNGLRMHVESDWGKGDLQVPLLGAFNAANLLAALGTLLASGIAFDDALQRLSDVQPVPGRMQGHGGTNQQPLVVVDYAHTPDALQQVLVAVRAHAAVQAGAVIAPKLWCVFGCGGDRDRSKRPLMAAAAEQLADKVIVTDDNPRTENAQVIVADILQGFSRVDDVLVIADRASAIEKAILSAAEDDVVLIAGKGHEDVQIVGDERLPFNDAHEVERVLALRKSAGGQL